MEFHEITDVEQDRNVEAMPWVSHPLFKGVSMKHLISGKETEGQMSCHVVRVEPECSLDYHVHDGQWELHEVIDGDGTGRLKTRTVSYSAGRVTLIPKGTGHSVKAGESGLVMLAKFFPALI